tara:strand:- start:8687 stop:9367 length:681 start_codon:yes stop_codon:yes gene_type:complete
MIKISLKEIALVIFSLFLYMVSLVFLVMPIEIIFGISTKFGGAILGIAWQISVLFFLFQYSIKKRLSYDFFGISFPNSWKYYIFAWAGSYLIFIFYGLFLYILEFFGITNAIDNFSGQELPFSKNENIYLLILMTISITIIAPIVEEILFRGYLFKALLSHFPIQVSALISGLSFSLFHLQLTVVIPFMFVGWLFANTRIRSGSLLPSIFAHASINSLSMIYFFAS